MYQSLFDKVSWCGWLLLYFILLCSSYASYSQESDCVLIEEVSLDQDEYNGIELLTEMHPELPMFNCFVQKYLIDNCGNKQILERRLAYNVEQLSDGKFYGDHVYLIHFQDQDMISYKIESGNGYFATGVLLLEDKDVVRHETAMSCAGASECYTIRKSWLNGVEMFAKREKR